MPTPICQHPPTKWRWPLYKKAIGGFEIVTNGEFERESGNLKGNCLATMPYNSKTEGGSTSLKSVSILHVWMSRPRSLLCSRVKSKRSSRLFWFPFMAFREDTLIGRLGLHLLRVLYIYSLDRVPELGTIQSSGLTNALYTQRNFLVDIAPTRNSDWMYQNTGKSNWAY